MPECYQIITKRLVSISAERVRFKTTAAVRLRPVGGSTALSEHGHPEEAGEGGVVEEEEILEEEKVVEEEIVEEERLFVCFGQTEVRFRSSSLPRADSLQLRSRSARR